MSEGYLKVVFIQLKREKSCISAIRSASRNSEIWQLTSDSVIEEEKPLLMLFYYRSANSHPIFSPIGQLNKILERFCLISTWDTVTHDSEVGSPNKKNCLSVLVSSIYVPNFSPIRLVEKMLWRDEKKKKKKKKKKKNTGQS